MRYSAPLDGIRAIAILAVLIFHVSPGALSGGFTGVDVFLVLSGFLITSIILHDLRDGSFSLREFYLRRIQRLLPNVLIMVLAVLVLWKVFMPTSAMVQAAHHGLWTILNLSNIYILKYLGGYWGDAAESSPLTHTWSLGIEEQFYLLFPGSLLLLAKFQPGRMRSWLAGAAILGFVLCLYSTRRHPIVAFYYLPTRIWELLIGAALAAYLTPLRKEGDKPSFGLGVEAQEALGLAGLVTTIMGFVFIGEGSGFPGFAALAPTVGTGLVLLSVTEEKTRLAHVLASPLLVRTGKLSYSIYLWHWPLIVLGKALADLYGRPQIYGSILGGIVSILLAMIAYVCVERPLRKRGPGRSWRFAMIAAVFLIVACSALALRSQHPVADPAHRFDTPAFFGEQYSAGDAEVEANLARHSTKRYDIYFPALPDLRPVDLWRTGGVIHLYGDKRPEVVVFGSSHALMYSKLIDDICREENISVAFLGVDGATPAFFTTTVNYNFSSLQKAQEFDEARRSWLRKWRPKVVFLIDRWDARVKSQQSFDNDLRLFLQEIGTTAGRVIFVSQVPVIRSSNTINLREMVTWRMRAEKKLPRFDPDLNEQLRKQALAAAEAATTSFPNLRVLRPDLCFYREDGSVRYESGRSFFYADGDHLTQAGAELTRDMFRGAIAEATSGSSSQACSVKAGTAAGAKDLN